jgi:predicted AAA+ superfamily ATPase
MPHQRTREVLPLLKKTLKHSPVVGILGQRQVGKTTLTASLASSYETLDIQATLTQAERDPEGFIDLRKEPFGIDECQLAPSLFPAIKEAVRKKQRPGRFILTGSVRFLSRKAIRESLTGRIVNIEVLPFSIPETHGSSPKKTLQNLAKKSSLEHYIENHFSSTATRSLFADFDRYLERGGLPGICFLHDSSVRERKFEAHIETLLERDLRLLQPTTLPFSQLRALLTSLAVRQGEPLELTELSRETRISTVTLKRLLLSFEGLFLIRRLRTEGGRAKDVIFLEDQGFAHHLQIPRPRTGMDLVCGLYSSLRTELHYETSAVRWSVFQFRTPKGAYLPLCFQVDGKFLGISPSLEENPARADIVSAQQFQKAYPGAKVIFATSAKQAKILRPDQAIIPYALLVR